ncbi:hypothetical protein SCUCBS95973_003114 [Sporothrix curviconia]|uniref:Uncharacterized protein n=1 Tax=Sporothrix curviconia TaxID=1260050 RepID=A0ABP0BCK2_9PEZI
MSPIPVTALVSSLLAFSSPSPTHGSRALYTYPTPPSSPSPLTSTTHITPAIAMHRVACVLLASLSKRDDDDDNDMTTSEFNARHLNVIFPSIVGFFLVATIWVCTRRHFKSGGTWKSYFKGWGQAVFFLAMLTVFLPFTILGCFINARRKKNPALAQAQRRGAAVAKPLQPANNPHSNREPPAPMRPQMPLDPVVVIPDLPDQEDPDAVERIERVVLPMPPPPIQQKNDTTAEATVTMLDYGKASP